jgi:hypothetical protein
MKHRYGDVIKVLANTEISHGMTLTNGKTYDIRRATEYGVHIVDDRGESFFVPKSQLHYTEIVKEENGMDEDYVMGAELGEPSADCNVTLSEIHGTQRELGRQAQIEVTLRNIR